MKTFTEYLTESKKTYTFKIKVAGDVTSEHEGQMKTMLERFSMAGFKKVGKTPIQSLPLDFPQVKNCEVSIYEVTLDYPTTSNELSEYLVAGLHLNRQNLVVRSPHEPTEEYQTEKEKRTGALLTDGDFKEAAKIDGSDYYGEKFNSGLLKDLNATLKQQQKDRGEVRPTATEGK
jgi:hypothetical protein